MRKVIKINVNYFSMLSKGGNYVLNLFSQVKVNFSKCDYCLMICNKHWKFVILSLFHNQNIFVWNLKGWSVKYFVTLLLWIQNELQNTAISTRFIIMVKPFVLQNFIVDSFLDSISNICPNRILRDSNQVHYSVRIFLIILWIFDGKIIISWFFSFLSNLGFVDL